MREPYLIIMAAGMGSRYGGLKQMDPIDDLGNVILHYSLHDAIKAGFKDVVFVIKKENEEDFKRIVTDRVKDKINVHFAYQSLDDVPEGFVVPAERVKPFGTGHAVRACRNIIKDAPFAVINADDFYGANAFRLIYDYLINAEDSHFAMVGFLIGNTVTENGSVARGVCEMDENAYLLSVTERTRIEKLPDGPAFTLDDGATWTHLPEDTLVSMNFWGFTPDFMKAADEGFAKFLANCTDKIKGEYYLPQIVEDLLEEKKADVKVLKAEDKWYGVTYREDKSVVVAALKALRDAGQYMGTDPASVR